MKTGFINILGFLVFFLSTALCGQNSKNIEADTVFTPNSNKVNKSNIKTVILRNSIGEGSYPIISLSGKEKLLLSFDDLHADLKDYQYTLTPCDYNWVDAELKPYEYLEGFQTDLIEENESSLGTEYPYTHYYINFPTEYLHITKSGNYLLHVFEKEWNRQNTIINYRFMILDPQVRVSGKIKRAMTGSDEQGYNQMLEIGVKLGDNYFVNPAQNIRINILQNGRWDNARIGISPSTIIGNTAEFYNNDQLVFKSGNEYRHFDFKDFKYHTEDIRNIESTPMGYVVDLSQDKRRTYDQYYSKQDHNGRYMIRTQRGREPDYEADYAEVNFYLPYDFPIGFGDLYISGQLSNGILSRKAKMTYNYAEKRYENTLLLKQGYYEYLYAYLEKGETKGDVSFIEGNHLDTENEYLVLVYYREPGSNYDQLVGKGIIRK
ncbi:MAG: DUF5103 domain-containing protein [Bacteroidota bacterium]|nr:DUF5103 domain-containing protein [Bacteroidota bacterium]